jgi:hypothetical protein
MLKAMKNAQTERGVRSTTGGLPCMTLSRSGFIVLNHRGGTRPSNIEYR